MILLQAIATLSCRLRNSRPHVKDERVRPYSRERRGAITGQRPVRTCGPHLAQPGRLSGLSVPCVSDRLSNILSSADIPVATSPYLAPVGGLPGPSALARRRPPACHLPCVWVVQVGPAAQQHARWRSTQPTQLRAGTPSRVSSRIVTPLLLSFNEKVVCTLKILTCTLTQTR